MSRHRADAGDRDDRADAGERGDAGRGDRGGRYLVGAEALARIVGVPASVLAYLEARLPQIRAVRDGARRAYRPPDAVLLAGLAEMLYRDGVSFRDAAAMLRTEGRADVIARGEALLRELLPAEAAPLPARTIPPDALVGMRGGGGGAGAAARPPPPPPSADVAALLSELIDCVRILEDGRAEAEGRAGNPGRRSGRPVHDANARA